MDLLTFISEVVKPLAWPGFLLIVLFLFRKPLRELLSAVSRLRIKGVEVDFDRKLSDVEQHTIRQDVQIRLKGPPDHGGMERLWQLAEISPRAAILEAWLLLEVAAVEVATERGWSVTGGAWQVFHVLEKEGVLQTQELSAIDELRALRNQAVHSAEFEVSGVQAVRYVELVQTWRTVVLLGKIPQ